MEVPDPPYQLGEINSATPLFASPSIENTGAETDQDIVGKVSGDLV